MTRRQATCHETAWFILLLLLCTVIGARFNCVALTPLKIVHISWKLYISGSRINSLWYVIWLPYLLPAWWGTAIYPEEFSKLGQLKLATMSSKT